MQSSKRGRRRGDSPDGDAPAAVHGSKRGTLAWLAEQTWRDGLEPALRALEGKLSRGDLDPYAIWNPGEGRRAERNDMTDRTIRYSDYSPPSLWGVAYSLLRVEVEPKEKSELMFHAGEEVLIPVTGTVRYRFARPSPAGVTTEDKTVSAGEAIRIIPQRPHHAWAVGSDATVWMAMRYASDSARGVVTTDTRLYEPPEKYAIPRTVTLEQLQSPATYAFVAWGLSELIRVHRQRANLTIEQLAKICSLDAALLSRIEAVQRRAVTTGTNLTLDGLIRIAEFLGLPLPQLIEQAVQRPYQHEPDLHPSASSGITARSVLGSPLIAHHLHLHALEFHEGVEAIAPASCRFRTGTAASWIVLKGAITVGLEIEDPFRLAKADEGLTRVTLAEGSVLHFRTARPSTILSHENAKVVQIVHSTDCGCVDTPATG